MAIIVDADVIIRAEKGLFDFQGWVNSQPEERFEMAAITVAELWHGVERASGAHRVSREKFIELVQPLLPVVPYTEETAYVHARLWAELLSTGNMIGAHDLIVAATALERGSEVATFNRREFSRIKGLSVIEPG